MVNLLVVALFLLLVFVSVFKKSKPDDLVDLIKPVPKWKKVFKTAVEFTLLLGLLILLLFLHENFREFMPWD